MMTVWKNGGTRKRESFRNSAEYRAWYGAHSRCKTHPRYAGRGIKVCERWASYENFLADMGPRPSPAHSLDRINNSGNYSPGNCRWATKSEQAMNQRPRISTQWHPENKPLSIALRKARERLGESQHQFAARLGVKQSTISRWEEFGPTRAMIRNLIKQVLTDIERVHPTNPKD